MYQFKPVYNDWLNIYPIFEKANALRFYDYLDVNLDIKFFQSLQFDYDSLQDYRKEAAIEASKMLGDRPALCFSGGVDSQYMLYAWKEARLQFDTYVLVFDDDLNDQDVSHARNYCRELGIELKEIPIDIARFLTRENYDYGMKYDSASPHFNTHYKLFNILKDMGYTGVCCGGNTPTRILNKNQWGTNYVRNVWNFINYTKVEQFPCIGDFLSFHPKLTWALALLTAGQYNTELFDVYFNEESYKNAAIRYAEKVTSYRKTGVKILEQVQKFTGFEKVKIHFEKKTGDGWAFEKLFRTPFRDTLMHTTATPVFRFQDGVQDVVDKLNDQLSKNFDL